MKKEQAKDKTGTEMNQIEEEKERTLPCLTVLQFYYYSFAKLVSKRHSDRQVWRFNPLCFLHAADQSNLGLVKLWHDKDGGESRDNKFNTF